MWGVCKLGSGVNVGNVNLGQHHHFEQATSAIVFECAEGKKEVNTFNAGE